MAKIKKLKKSKKTRQPDKSIIDQEMSLWANEHYLRYGKAVLEDRSVPDLRDGMAPVNRRVLWSTHKLGIHSTAKFVKAARIIGDTLGRYHPHGDTSCYGAMVNMTNVGKVTNNIIHGLIEGEGNWGDMSSGQAAAMRYTEARLSKFADNVLFNPFYLPVVDMVPNYDSSTEEPLILPALLPVLFMNGRFGIAPGATTNIPSFTSESILSVLEAAYRGEELTPKFLAQNLLVTSTYGGKEKLVKGDLARKALFTAKRGSVILHSTASWDDASRQLTIEKFANSNIAKVMEKIDSFAGVQEVRDDSDTSDKYGKLVVQFKRLDLADMKKLRAKIMDLMTSKENYVLNFTERYVDKTGQAEATMMALTLSDAFTQWVKWRIKLEVKASKYWMKKAQEEIRKLELLILAVDNRAIIIKSLDQPGSQDDLNKWLAKKLKITPDEAAFIYDLKVRQLRALEKKDLQVKLKDTHKKFDKLELRATKPRKFMVKQLDELAGYIAE